MKKQADVIIFDLDGTLIDSKIDIVNSVNLTLKELGFPKQDKSFIANLIGRGVDSLIKDALGQGRERYFNKAIDIFKKQYKAHQLDNTSLYPNVKKTLGFFAPKFKAIASNKSEEFVVDTITGLGIAGYFDIIIGGDDPDSLKPSPKKIKIILDTLKARHDRAIFVGDMPIDIETAKRADIMSCAVTYGLGSKRELIDAKPDYIISDIFKLADIIE